MKTKNRIAFKTEASPEKQLVKKCWIDYTTQRGQSRVAGTPIRFSDISFKRKGNNLESGSTEDRQQEQKTISNHNPTEIDQALALLKGLNTLKGQENSPIRGDITPFDLIQEKYSFQEQLSFKGVNNRQILLNLILVINDKNKSLHKSAQQLQHKTRRSKSTRSIKGMILNQKIKVSESQFSSYIAHLKTKIEQFIVQINRCQLIITKTTGISNTTLMTYQSKFDDLIKQLEINVDYLQKYSDLLLEMGKHSCVKIQKRRKVSKFDAR